MKKFVVILLIAVVGVPWTAFPAAKGEACSMPRATAACSYCTPAASGASAGPTLEAGCCRFLPKPESVPAQAGSIETTAKPLQLPDIAAAIPWIDGPSASAATAARGYATPGASPPYAPPIRTTHLLL